MISVSLQLDSQGCLRRLQSTGHAIGPQGGNTVCAAATALMRSASRALADHSSIVISGHAPREGVLEIEVLQCGAEYHAYLRGVTDVLLRGLKDLALDEPSEVTIRQS